MAHIVIVGGGVAAGKAAETLREEGYDGDVTIVAAEPHPPYQRPPLSKGYLAGSEGLDAAILHPAELVRRARHRAAHVDGGDASGSRCAPTRASTAATLAYDSVLLATGASPR